MYFVLIELQKLSALHWMSHFIIFFSSLAMAVKYSAAEVVELVGDLADDTYGSCAGDSDIELPSGGLSFVEFSGCESSDYEV